MEVVKRYIHAVTQKLPEQQRADIEKELHGLIQDMVEERVQGGEITQNDVEEVLLELGNPSDLADKYRGSKRYLIGPELFPTYLFVLKIALAAIAIATTVAFVIETLLDPAQIQSELTSYISSIISGFFQGFAWVTIIFFLVDYKGINKSKLGMDSWKLSDLPPLPNQQARIKMSEPIVSITFTIILLVLMTFSIDLFGVSFTRDISIRTIIPIFDGEVFHRFLPFIWIVFAISILSDIMKIIAGRWSIKLIVFDIVAIVLHFVLAVFMFADSSIWNPHFMQQIAQTDLILNDNDTLQTIQTVWSYATQGILSIIGVILGIQLITTIIKYFKIRDFS